MLIGSRYHAIFWFQFNLIFLSLFFTIISFAFKFYLINISQIFGIISFYIHISGINFNFFSSFNPKFSINIGSIIELLPIAVLGLILGSKNFLSQIQQYTFSFYMLIIFSIYILFQYNIFVHTPGIRYPDILLNIFGSLFLFIAFGFFPYKSIKKNKFSVLLNNIIRFTGGIYHLHPRIRRILQKLSYYFYTRKTYSNSLIIYTICYLICFVGTKIFRNSQLKYLFM